MPPKGRKLLVIATTSRKHVLDELEMIHAFTDVLHVANLSKPEHVSAVARASEVISPAGLKQLESQLSGRTANIGVKKLLGQTGLGPRNTKAADLMTSVESAVKSRQASPIVSS